jgi:membrane protein required for beta-lactamase induction
MTFLTILVAVIFYRNWFGEHPLSRFLPFESLLDRAAERGIQGLTRYFLCIGLPVLVLLIISGMSGGLLWLALSLVVVIYSIELYDGDSVFDEHLIWLRDQQAAGDDSDDFKKVSDVVDVVDVVDIDDIDEEDDELDPFAEVSQHQEDFILTATYEVFQSFIPVVFWFILLGPAGALFYALTIRYLDSLDLDSPQIELMEQVVYWLEWMPARITGLLFAFLANFGPGFEYWLKMLTDVTEPNEVHLSILAGISTNVPDEDRPKVESDDLQNFIVQCESHVNDLRILFERAIFGWLGIAALVTVIAP